MSAKRMQHRARVYAWVFALLALAFPPAVRAALPPGPLGALQSRLDAAALRAPGRVGIAVEDLATGSLVGVNAGVSLPAASTIKIPVMVEVFRQMQDGSIDLDTNVTLRSGDRDWGSGELCDAAPGTGRTVRQLLWVMITRSDNTATNMLIRMVGRTHINRTMADLGLHDTRVGDYIRSQTDAIRYALRTSPRDMVKLLDSIARDRLIDEWSSREMLAILTGQLHNGLLPVALPKYVKIAHKTGSLHDTLNDVGIVYHDEEPYVIAVMTTQLADLDLGRAFIHRVSRIAFAEFQRFGAYRATTGLPVFDVGGPASNAGDEGPMQAMAPDLLMWNAPATPQ